MTGVGVIWSASYVLVCSEISTGNIASISGRRGLGGGGLVFVLFGIGCCPPKIFPLRSAVVNILSGGLCGSEVENEF